MADGVESCKRYIRRAYLAAAAVGPLPLPPARGQLGRRPARLATRRRTTNTAHIHATHERQGKPARLTSQKQLVAALWENVPSSQCRLASQRIRTSCSQARLMGKRDTCMLTCSTRAAHTRYRDSDLCVPTSSLPLPLPALTSSFALFGDPSAFCNSSRRIKAGNAWLGWLAGWLAAAVVAAARRVQAGVRAFFLAGGSQASVLSCPSRRLPPSR